MHIYTLSPKCLQCFTQSHAAVREELCLHTVHYYIQDMANNPSSKGQKFTENNEIGNTSYYAHLHFYSKYLKSFADF